MRLKVFPVTSIGLPHLKFKLRPPATLPFVVFGSGIYNPVRFKPRKSKTVRKLPFQNAETALNLSLLRSLLPVALSIKRLHYRK